MKTEKRKVTAKDLPIQKGQIDVEFIEVEGRKIILTHIPYSTIDQYVTHTDCNTCGQEFKKNTTYQVMCNSCQSEREREKYYALPVAKDSYKGIVYDSNTDRYFQDTDEVKEYYVDEEINLEDAMLLTTVPTTFREISLEYLAEDTYEDWVPSEKLNTALYEFNELLKTESTNTVYPGKERIALIIKHDALITTKKQVSKI